MLYNTGSIDVEQTACCLVFHEDGSIDVVRPNKELSSEEIASSLDLTLEFIFYALNHENWLHEFFINFKGFEDDENFAEAISLMLSQDEDFSDIFDSESPVLAERSLYLIDGDLKDDANHNRPAYDKSTSHLKLYVPDNTE